MPASTCAHTAHRHKYTRHTSLCPVIDSRPRDGRCASPSERRGDVPALAPTDCCNPGKSPAGCPETVFTSHLCPIPGAGRARGAFSLKAVCLGTCVKVGLPRCSRSPSGRVLLTQDCVASCRHARHVVQGDWGQQAECKRVQAAWGREPLPRRSGAEGGEETAAQG